MTADQIIVALGGTSAVADKLELTPSTVSSWRTANFIPRWWQESLLKLPVVEGRKLVAKDFPPKRPRKATPPSEQAVAA